MTQTTTPGLPEATELTPDDRQHIDQTADGGTSFVSKFAKMLAFRPLFNLSATMNANVGVAGTARQVDSASGPWTPDATEGQWVDITGTTTGFVVNALPANHMVVCRVPQAVAAAINLSAYKIVGAPAGTGSSVLHLENGRKLIGSTGFSCVLCHDFAGRAATGSRAPDLTQVHRRHNGVF